MFQQRLCVPLALGFWFKKQLLVCCWLGSKLAATRFFAYGPQTANLAEVFLSMVVAQFVAVRTGQWPNIWKAKPLSFGHQISGEEW